MLYRHLVPNLPIVGSSFTLSGGGGFPGSYAHDSAAFLNGPSAGFLVIASTSTTTGGGFDINIAEVNPTTGVVSSAGQVYNSYGFFGVANLVCQFIAIHPTQGVFALGVNANIPIYVFNTVGNSYESTASSPGSSYTTTHAAWCPSGLALAYTGTSSSGGGIIRMMIYNTSTYTGSSGAGLGIASGRTCTALAWYNSGVLFALMKESNGSLTMDVYDWSGSALSYVGNQVLNSSATSGSASMVVSGNQVFVWNPTSGSSITSCLMSWTYVSGAYFTQNVVQGNNTTVNSSSSSCYGIGLYPNGDVILVDAQGTFLWTQSSSGGLNAKIVPQGFPSSGLYVIGVDSASNSALVIGSMGTQTVNSYQSKSA